MLEIRRIRVNLLALVFMLGSACLSHAQQPDLGPRRNTFTPGELALLPPYCDTRHGREQWRGLIGDEVKHIHHYCRGLRDANFAKFAVVTQAQRDFLWTRATSEYSYMIRNSRPNNPILPEMHFHMGEAFLNLKKYDAADAAFTAARNLKPDYIPAYTAWADKLLELKLYSKAKALLEDGIKHAPNNPELNERLSKLSRIPSRIESVSPEPEPTARQEPAKTETATQGSPESAPTETEKQEQVQQ